MGSHEVAFYLVEFFNKRVLNFTLINMNLRFFVSKKIKSVCIKFAERSLLEQKE
ncbi:hypothetical protein THERMOT_1877 [Bathymodiolus thermophilus thioautotrophic gill symbiont]|uniref:Uncharacterized protein n=1 Tax=Bathymodiolus thermophilus thioautotrophic gill symbiont TaxID=2360 RepID=A0A8H8XD71_9GAMM|nr:hypothetical protein THERMOT_1877 [Bathymodiolus thermophilus thioautotrophic gill symbiont]CAB5505995.1 hypothetical protein THERMOS_2224 [Bathymodiolus thermophilus thioautotrophic gill symbiont]